LGDDSFSYLVDHIVGLGKSAYQNITPEKTARMTEERNFEGF
jgi:hypothetical protein